MSRGSRIDLYVGARILFLDGPRLVTAVSPMGYTVLDVQGRSDEVPWPDVQAARGVIEGRVDAVTTSVGLMFEGLTEDAKQQALDRQEVVLTIDTGYANGHPALARPGEPFTAFDPRYGLSLAKRIDAMARLLEQEASASRAQLRVRETRGKSVAGRLDAPAVRTIREWHTSFHALVNGGLFALVDGRKRRSHSAWASLDPELRRICDEITGEHDGSASMRSIDELHRRVRLTLKAEGLHDVPVPEATVRRYLSHQMRSRGRTTRSHLTTHLRGPMSVSAYPALRPGQVVAIDVTRADNFVVEPWTGKVVSVEIITAIDIATRVVLALRVVPRSARAIEAGMIMYDVLRPFSMSVTEDRMSDWRWAGVPEHIGEMSDALAKAEELSGRPLIGEHAIPGLLPEAVRADHGSIFTGSYFRALCDRLDIHLLLSRGKKPTDNAFVERWHETLQRCLQQLSGHKGRNVLQRGSLAGRIQRDPEGHAVFQGGGTALTPRQLEVRLREFIATDYHRTPHGGIAIVDRKMPADEVWMTHTPLECFDAMLEATGRLHVLQRPDLIYDFLVVRWGTIRHEGVEFNNLTYDSHELDEFRNVPKGFFRDEDRAAPFFYDERDLSRVWFRHPVTDEIIEVPWRRAFQLQAPMTEVTFNRARTLVRMGRGPRTRKVLQEEILDAVNDMSSEDRMAADPSLRDWGGNALAASSMRYQRANFDHAEASAARSRPRDAQIIDLPSARVTAHGVQALDEPWPDYQGMND